MGAATTTRRSTIQAHEQHRGMADRLYRRRSCSHTQAQCCKSQPSAIRGFRRCMHDSLRARDPLSCRPHSPEKDGGVLSPVASQPQSAEDGVMSQQHSHDADESGDLGHGGAASAISKVRHCGTMTMRILQPCMNACTCICIRVFDVHLIAVRRGCTKDDGSLVFRRHLAPLDACLCLASLCQRCDSLTCQAAGADSYSALWSGLRDHESLAPIDCG
jgi:hypothetical protein